MRHPFLVRTLGCITGYRDNWHLALPGWDLQEEKCTRCRLRRQARIEQITLSKPGYVRGSGSAVVAELLPEAILEEPVFDLYADLGANEEDDHSDGEEHRGRDHGGGGENQAQHRRINRMTDDAIRPAADKLMVGIQGSFESKMSAEGACAGPGKHAGNHQEENGKGKTPNRKRHAPKTTLPDSGVRDDLEKDAPAGA